MIFTLLALSGAAAATYTDLKQGIIPNRLTGALFVTGVAGHLLLEGRGAFLPLLRSVLLVFAIGYLLWWLGAWSAGDAKELLFLAALLPDYPGQLRNWFKPSLAPYPFALTILVNTFLALFPFLLLYGLWIGVRKGVLQHLLQPFRELRETFFEALAITAALLMAMALNMNLLSAIPLLLILHILGNWAAMLGFALGGAGFLYRSGEPLTVLAYLLSTALGLLLFKLLWNSVGVVRKLALRERMPVEDLREGMILAAPVQAGGRRIETLASGLGEEDVRLLRELNARGELTEVEVKRAMPFAPAILLGLVLSLALGDLTRVVGHG